MRAAVTYEEWAHAARMLDRENAARGASKCDLYDEEIVRNKLQELRQRREEGSLRDIVFCMRADLLRNLGDMCNPQLHKGRLQVCFIHRFQKYVVILASLWICKDLVIH